MKKVVAVILVFMLLTALVACGGTDGVTESVPSTETTTEKEASTVEESSDSSAVEPDETVTINFWYQYNEGNAESTLLEENVKAFMKANPDIIVNMEPVQAAQDGLATKIATALVANDLPDVFQFWASFSFFDMVDAGLLMNVEEYFAVSEKVKKEDINKSALDYYTYNGKLSGFPTHLAYPGWFANKAIFEELNLEIPTTMQEFMAIAPVLQNNGIVPLAMGSSGGNPGHFFLSELQHQYAGGTEDIEALPTTYQFDTESLRKTAQMIIDMKAAGVLPEDTVANGDWPPAFELYNSGKAAILYTYSFFYSTLNEEIYNNSVIIDPLMVNGGTVPTDSFVQTFTSFGLLATQKAWEEKQEAIVRFMDWMYSEESVQSLVDGGSLSPTLNTNPTITNPIVAAVVDHYKGRDGVGSHFQYTQNQNAWLGFQPLCDQLFAGALTAEQFATEVQAVYTAEKP